MYVLSCYIPVNMYIYILLLTLWYISKKCHLHFAVGHIQSVKQLRNAYIMFIILCYKQFLSCHYQWYIHIDHWCIYIIAKKQLLYILEVENVILELALLHVWWQPIHTQHSASNIKIRCSLYNFRTNEHSE